MRTTTNLSRRLLAGATLACLAIGATLGAAQPSQAQQVRRVNTNADLQLSVGRGHLINLPTPMSDVFVANDDVADVQVRSNTQLFIFGKAPGETSIYATDANGRVVYSVVARVGNNIETIDQMLALAMPDAQIQVNTMNGFVLLTGTVAAPEDAAEADRLVAAFVGEGTRVLSRLQTATPLQVNLQVRIAEVNRSVVQAIGGNLSTFDESSGLQVGVFRGRENAARITRQDIGNFPTRLDPATGATRPYDPYTGEFITAPRYQSEVRALADAATIALGGNLFGMPVLAALDIAERTGMVTTLAQPNLTTVSGESADFLAGGEYPVPVPDPLTGAIAIEYRRFGVSLAYTPTVLSNGRISIRVRPEVSELSTEGAIRLQGIEIPALTVRRAETTVELGSGESFMIAGLMNNRSIETIDRTPGAADVPIIGALFRSTNFRRGDSELVIVVTPYLVRPVNANDIRLPTDGYQSATFAQRMLMNGIADGRSGEGRPVPTLETGQQGEGGQPATPGDARPAISNAAPRSEPNQRGNRRNNANSQGNAAPGFTYGQ